MSDVKTRPSGLLAKDIGSVLNQLGYLVCFQTTFNHPENLNCIGALKNAFSKEAIKKKL